MKTVIEMAGQAFETPGTEPAFRNGFWTVTQEELERFAELVRADAIADEREACAKVCEAEAEKWKKKDLLGYVAVLVDDAAAAIRARSNT